MTTAPELKGVLATALGVDEAEIGDDASMDTVEAWDSLRHLYVVMALEEAFGVTFDDDEAVSITSLALIRQSLERRGVALAGDA